MRDRFLGCLAGMAIGESMATSESDRLGNESKSAMCCCHALIGCDKDKKEFLKLLGEYLASSGVEVDDCRGVLSMALPVGLFLHSDMIQVMDWTKDASQIMCSIPVVQASSVAIALMSMLSVTDVPVGLWANELYSPLNGISCSPRSPTGTRDELMESMGLATKLASSSVEPSNALSRLGTKNSPGLASSSLFCLMHGAGSFDETLGTCISDPILSAMAGGLFGARMGMKSIPSSIFNSFPAKNLIEKIAGDLLTASRG